MIKFQSTHSRGVRPTSSGNLVISRSFQSTHSRGVRHRPSSSSRPMRCFNPRTHEECDLTPFRNFHLQIVSIHALTRSATIAPLNKLKSMIVSIHALTRSATSSFPSTCCPGNRFNPRTHEECDPAYSTNATRRHRFNPRTHEECD